MPENRRFTRIVFSTPVKLKAKRALWVTELVDISLKGALVKKPDKWTCNIGDQFTLTFMLAGSDIDIHMLVHKAHQDEDMIGFTCDSIDIDSASHLRRLIELNVGSADLLNRDLEHLSHPEEE
ncbi:MAG: hypothetical protein ACI8WB_004071 [Phenylobacterium sp.]|jgi:hypothetical protein